MTNTKTLIPPEYIKQSLKLQEIECDRAKWIFIEKLNGGIYKKRFTLLEAQSHWAMNKDNLKEYWRIGFTPDIADVIDNAEFLFGIKSVRYWCGKAEEDETGKDCCDTWQRYKYIYIQNEILRKCQQNKSIKEISEYIINNIK